MISWERGTMLLQEEFDQLYLEKINCEGGRGGMTALRIDNWLIYKLYININMGMTLTWENFQSIAILILKHELIFCYIKHI